MAYPPRYVRYLNLPPIPDSVINTLNRDYTQYEFTDSKIWSKSFNDSINEWCKKNICEDMYYAFQIIQKDVPIHKDNVTVTKINYIIDTGGPQVATRFWNEDRTEILQSEILEPNRWHIMKVDVYHDVFNVEPGSTRFSITGRVFE